MDEVASKIVPDTQPISLTSGSLDWLVGTSSRATRLATLGPTVAESLPPSQFCCPEALSLSVERELAPRSFSERSSLKTVERQAGHEQEVHVAVRLHLGAPLFVAQGSSDVVVAPDVTKQFVTDACQRGEQVRFVVISDGIHRTTAEASAQEALGWMADRFAGKPAPSDCSAQ